MSVREEDRNKNCPSRGLGIAAAAIGVGVGAALYYYFNKRPENPADEGATTSGWTCEQPHSFNHHDSYTTISEHSTTDTSINSDSERDSYSEAENESDEAEIESVEMMNDPSYYPPNWDVRNRLWHSIESDTEFDEFSDSSTNSNFSHSSEWPEYETETSISYAGSAREQPSDIEDQAFRERSWSLEECSICFEVMLLDQEVMALGCTHRFHQACIMPWLQEKQTCPNCRKAS